MEQDREGIVMRARTANLPLAIAAIFFVTFIAEAKKIPMTAASIVPSAMGEIESSKDHNGNTKVDIKVDHLANPANLTPPANTYVVWFQERGGEPQNKGVLTVNKDLKGEFSTVTPSKVFDVFVTGEATPNVPAPSGPEVLRATVQQL
jgi:hypothetical protein